MTLPLDIVRAGVIFPTVGGSPLPAVDPREDTYSSRLADAHRPRASATSSPTAAAPESGSAESESAIPSGAQSSCPCGCTGRAARDPQEGLCDLAEAYHERFETSPEPGEEAEARRLSVHHAMGASPESTMGSEVIGDSTAARFDHIPVTPDEERAMDLLLDLDRGFLDVDDESELF